MNKTNNKILDGLDVSQIEKLVQEGKTNKVSDLSTNTYKKIIFRNSFTFFNFLFLGIAISLVSVGAYSDLIFLIVVSLNLILGIYQEIKSKKIIDSLKLINTPLATVIRNGKELEIDIQDVVLGDIIKVNAGEQIPADAIVIKGRIETNESMLTGESDLIKKQKDSKLFGGSFVVSGSCFAQTNAVGNDTYVHGLTKQVKTLSKPNSEILKALNWLIRIITLIIIPLAYFLFANNIESSGWDQAIIQTAAGIIGMIPAGLYLMTSVSLAVGARKLAKSNTLVQNLYCIEMLARVNVLCLDKTGTITDGSMSVDDFFVTDNSYDKDKISGIIASMLSHLKDTNQTAIALNTYFSKPLDLTANDILPFSSQRKYSAVSFKSNDTYVLGAPEFVINEMDRSTKMLFSKFTKQGDRVLALGKTKEKDIENKFSSVSLVAYIVISDNIREDAFETLKFFSNNNVDIKVISGDNIETVAEVSKQAGVPNSDKAISLAGLSDDEVIKASIEYTIFGRVLPEQKKLLVSSLKSNGLQVGMTGDGVNDILALKEADCSIAMAEGSDAAKNVAQLVLMDSNFANMPKVVKEGRRVINNIQKGSSLFLMKTVFSIMIIVLTILISRPYPFRPIQLTLIELFVIGLPAFLLALENNFEVVKGSFIKTALIKSLPASLVVTINILILYFVQDLFGFDTNDISTISVIATLYTGMFLLYQLCRPFNFYRTLVFTSMLSACIFCLVYLSEIFHIPINQLSRDGILMLIILMLLTYPIMTTLTRTPKTVKLILNEVSDLKDYILLKKERSKDIKKQILDKTKK